MNSRQNKDRKPKRPLFSIDGVSPSGPGLNSGSIGDFKRPGSHPGNRPKKRIDDFKRSEGFDPTIARGGAIAIPKRPQYEAPEEKRRFPWFWKRSRKNARLDSYEKKARRKKRLKIAGITLFIFLAIFGFLVAKGYINLRKVLGGGGSAAALEENVDPSKLRVEGDGRINILLLGRGGAGHEGADLTDTIILISIDPVAKEAGLISIPRDLYVRVPDAGSMKINSVFYTGKAKVLNNSSRHSDEVKKQAENAGFDLVENTVEEVLGVPVHYHAMIDFTGFKQAIDTVGGIDINVPQAIYERMRIDGRNYTLNVKRGHKHFNGFEALAYARSRYTSKRGDFDRSERQRLMILALKDKILSLGTFSNPGKLSSLLDQFGNHVQTNFSTDDISKLYSLASQIDSSKVTSIGLADPPNNFIRTANFGGLSVVIPSAGVNNYKDIHYYIRNTLRDSFLKMENANVMILNGTNRPGLANDKAYELKSFGYSVGKVDNAPTKNYSKTVIIDMGHGDKKYTRHYLQKRFNVLSSSNLPDASIQAETADFVIILGNDISSR
jgi:LCP family protein required for cell wall assembly